MAEKQLSIKPSIDPTAPLRDCELGVCSEVADGSREAIHSKRQSATS